MSDYVVFTDLDGTLLNHDDYSFDNALPMLDFIKAHNIPLIFTTSKTKLECEILQKEMVITSPFIVENGACIYYPDGEIELLGVPHSKIKTFLDDFDVLSFSNMTIEEIIKHTALDFTQAKHAKNREFSEPFLIEDEKRLANIKDAAKEEGLKILKGGRFYHCVGIDQDKGKAVQKVMNHYRDKISIGLGDNYNDIAMLEVVDIPILIPSKNGTIDTDIKDIIKAPYMGSLGWNEALKEVFKYV